MFKVLIADDEPKIRKGIKGILDWKEIGFEIVAEAEDGEMAFEKAKETHPDLLLLDICMPFLNGLELIDKLKSILNNPMIIIISGHDEFQYAQTALKLRVFDYLLKPVEKDTLLQTVLRAKEQMILKKNSTIKKEFTEKQLKKSSHYLKEAFMLDWVSGRVQENNVNEQLNYFNIEFTDTMGMIIVKMLQKNNNLLDNDWDADLLSYAIQNISEEAAGKFSSAISFKDSKNQIVIISDTNPIAKWYKLGTKIERFILEYLDREVITELTLMPADMGHIQEVYQEACSRISNKSQNTPIVITIQKYIDKHYANPDLSLTEIADKVGISQTYLTRLLKQELGLPFVDYLTQIRLKKAIMLMQDPNIKVYEIAEMVGYSSQHYFSNVFKKAFNISPLEYKKGGKK